MVGETHFWSCFKLTCTNNIHACICFVIFSIHVFKIVRLNSNYLYGCLNEFQFVRLMALIFGLILSSFELKCTTLIFTLPFFSIPIFKTVCLYSNICMVAPRDPNLYGGWNLFLILLRACLY